MEQKHLLMSALSVGVGVGVGLGLASGQSLSKWGGLPPNCGATAEEIEQEMLRQVMDGKSSKITFDKFPYYLSEQTRVLLISAASVHLMQGDFAKHTRNLSPASRTILLSGSAELYSQMLSRALAHFFNASLLLLDITDFSVKIQNKYGAANKTKVFRRSASEAALEKVSSLLESFSILSNKQETEAAGSQRRGCGSGYGLQRQSSGVEFRLRDMEGASRHRRNASASAKISSFDSQETPLRRNPIWAFDEKLFVQALYKVLIASSKKKPIILYIRDIDNLLHRSQKVYTLFQKLVTKISGPVLILGSRMLEEGDDYDYRNLDEKIRVLFPYNIDIKPPKDESNLESWKCQLKLDTKMIQIRDNRNRITEVLAENNIECDDLGSICLADTVILSNHIEEIIVSAISHHFMNNKDPEYKNGNLVISSKSLSHGLSIFQEEKLGSKVFSNLEFKGKNDARTKPGEKEKDEAVAPVKASKSEKPLPAIKDGKNTTPPPKFPAELPDNDFEKKLRSEVIPASEIGVSFDDIGSLNDIKESLHELVMLPLRRPDLFVGLLKPCKGILLFGPPGTGKTMLAKAIANEAGASFINVSMSTITSKWFGEDEKNVRALFTLAAKVSPTIIFIDEVDSMLGQRTRAGEHEAMRKIKNEFMTHWDGLLTKPSQRILVLGATNRPFDLDEAIIRRFERRIMVGLPTVESREQILKTFLSKERVETGINYKDLAVMTEGYSGSDLKNLCTTAAYRPVRELIQRERKNEEKKKEKETDCSNNPAETSGKKEGREVENSEVKIRELSMEDLRQAKKQVAASFASEGSIMAELRQWNEIYGEGGRGSREKQDLTYFI